jgi:hypothetical protein
MQNMSSNNQELGKIINIQTQTYYRQTFVTSEKNFNTLTTSKDLVLSLIFNFSISVTNALPSTKEKMCVSTNLWFIQTFKVSQQAQHQKNSKQPQLFSYLKTSNKMHFSHEHSKVKTISHIIKPKSIVGSWKYFFFFFFFSFFFFIIIYGEESM